MFLGYHHPSGEVHIMNDNEWVSCPGNNYVSRMENFTNHNLPILLGQDNPSKECIVGDVPNIFDGDLSNHDGPYNGITMGC